MMFATAAAVTRDAPPPPPPPVSATTALVRCPNGSGGGGRRGGDETDFARLPQRYEEIVEIGRGAFGVVYSAVDTLSPERARVAVKTLHAIAPATYDQLRALERERRDLEDLHPRLRGSCHGPPPPSTVRDRYRSVGAALREIWTRAGEDVDMGVATHALREIGMLRQLAGHENIVRIDHVTSQRPHEVFLALEYVDGGSLMDHMQRARRGARGHLARGAIRDLMRQLLSGLAHCHARGIVHRDIKPQNILVRRADGVLKISDFGAAFVVDMAGRSEASRVVTLYYRAPELLLGAQHYAMGIDVWAAGCVLAELASPTHAPIFAAENSDGVCDAIFRTLGMPTEATWPGVDSLPEYANWDRRFKSCAATRRRWTPSDPTGALRRTYGARIGSAGVDLLGRLLTMDPAKRITAAQALAHPFLSPSSVSIPKE